MKIEIFTVDIFAAVCLAIAVRAMVSLNSYSGAGTPPMYGDYEAQRHWQEITYNLPSRYWYTNSSDNDLLYWGLDYPPLTAYHSYLMATVANKMNSSYIELHKSRGYESKSHKTFMRSTVLFADVIIFLPACILTMLTIENNFGKFMLLPSIIFVLFYPALILIDNGHFQYNNISLGFLLLAISSILMKWHRCAATFFTLALNYKQMELYHALPFFAYLLSICYRYEREFKQMCWKLTQIASVVVLVFAIIWMPWLTSLQSIFAVLRRLFPINRGLFEDKVANFWCSLSIIYKFRENISNANMAIICLVTTLIAILPSCLHLYSQAKIKQEVFLYSLFNTAIAFFLFSYQVHEKSILLAAIPMTCLLPFLPLPSIWFLKLSTLSVFPLVIKDHLILPYFALITIFNLLTVILFKLNIISNSYKKFDTILNVIIYLLSLIAIFLPTLPNLPHLWTVAISTFCCFCFLIYFIVINLHQFNYNIISYCFKDKIKQK